MLENMFDVQCKQMKDIRGMIFNHQIYWLADTLTES